MFTRWTSHLTTEEEKEKFRLEIYSAKRVLERLANMLDEDMKSLDRSEEDHRSYLTPSWDYLQAHRNGNRQTYRTIMTLVDLDQQKGTIHDHKPTGRS